jgi:hypothetical protein
MTLRRAIRLLLFVVLGLPLVQAVLMWTAGLLAAMGDKAAASVVGHLNTGAGVAWLVALVGLIVALALQATNEPPVGSPPSGGTP